MLRTTLLLLVLLVSAASSAQAQVTIPITFSDGTPALASEVNQNFQALASAVNASNCATAGDLVCNPASVSCPACDTLGSYLQGQTSGFTGGPDFSYLIVLCQNAGGTFNTETSTCSVDITNSAAAIAAAGSAACDQGGGTWNAGTSTCTPAPAASSYNCWVGGFCSQAAIDFPPATYGYTNVYDGHTQGTEPALGAGCNVSYKAAVWSDGESLVSSLGSRVVGPGCGVVFTYDCFLYICAGN